MVRKRMLLVVMIVLVVLLTTTDLLAGGGGRSSRGSTDIMNMGGINGGIVSEQYHHGNGINGGSICDIVMLHSEQGSSIGGVDSYQETQGIAGTSLDQSIGAERKRRRCGGINGEGYQSAEVGIYGGGIEIVETTSPRRGCRGRGGSDDTVVQIGGVCLDINTMNDKQGPGEQTVIAGGAVKNTQFTVTPRITTSNTTSVLGGTLSSQSGRGTGTQVSEVTGSAFGTTVAAVTGR